MTKATSNFINDTANRSLVKKLGAGILRQLLPTVYWKLKVGRMSDREREQKLVPFLCARNKISIDIGAADGAYSATLCSVATRVFAFEPRPGLAALLREMAEACALPLDVKAVALSNETGTARLRIPTMDGGRSTIENANDLEDPDSSPCVEITVPKARLDEYGFKNVGFIKIDVEGHELSVLQGGEETIRHSMPTLLVEIEERHRPNSIEDVSQFLLGLGYEGFFILNDEIVSFSSFNKTTHQNKSNISGWKSGYEKSGTYINNFIWVPKGDQERLRCAMEKTKSEVISFMTGGTA